jgi:hypothetical protein
MLAQVFNPTEIKKNGPATRPASAPARRRASPFTAVSAVLPTTAQSYGDARRSVNGRSLDVFPWQGTAWSPVTSRSGPRHAPLVMDLRRKHQNEFPRLSCFDRADPWWR